MTWTSRAVFPVARGAWDDLGNWTDEGVWLDGELWAQVAPLADPFAPEDEGDE